MAVSRQEPLQASPPQEAQQAPSEQRALLEQPAQSLALSRQVQPELLPVAQELPVAPLALQQEEPPPARLMPRRVPRVSPQRWERAPPQPVREEPQGAFVQRAQPLLSPQLQPWPPLPPQLLLALALKSFCELSPQRLQGSSSSASSSRLRRNPAKGQ